jgi:hypothetical protein
MDHTLQKQGQLHGENEKLSSPISNTTKSPLLITKVHFLQQDC